MRREGPSDFVVVFMTNTGQLYHHWFDNAILCYVLLPKNETYQAGINPRMSDLN